MDKIKVLMVLGNTKMGGTQSFILNLLRNIDKCKFQVDLAINNEEPVGGIGDDVRQMGCQIYFWPYYKVFNKWKFVKFWREFLLKHPYNIVHGHSTNSAAVYLKVAKEMGCVTIAHSHSAGYRGGIVQQLLKKYYAKQVGNVADYWFACSDKAAERLYGKTYRDYPRYYDIPNAINAENYLYDLKKAKNIRMQLGVEDNEFLCGHVGTFSVPKNHSFLIKIFNEVLKIKPEAKLLCCGAGALMPLVKKKATTLGIVDRIIFPGVVKNCNEYMMAMDVFVFPSLFEGFPVSVIEAEATGLNVVMSDVITREVDLTPCIHRHSLADDPKRWAQIVCSLQKQDRPSCNKPIADSRYNIRTSIKLITGLYEKMLNKRNNEK